MYLLGLLICLGFAACDDDVMETGDPPPNPYDGCCATGSFNGMVDSSFIYIPNMFTPNFDGFNDFFIVHGSLLRADMVKSLQIFDQEGLMMFEASNIPTNDSQFYWSGSINGTDSIYQGLFNYTVLYDTGISETEIKGSACSYPCGPGQDQFPTANIEDCQFSTQHDGVGGLAPGAISFEEDCF